ncbi:helix-turn-helix transcriptional regulator [Glycomyces sp. NEAU-S30]|uniref:Helix-turn-helix transcriptional regulator n=1 Tax=Glycomyces niveus TaxID=2820287 RepID=A0ABS3U8B2_9ACTN|nr:helix-turn-helix transcriptional regulator [Glycomyces sp. NEAU-S30]
MLVGNQVAWPSTRGEREVFHRQCPAVQVLDHITSRWGIWVLLALNEGELRFFELRERVDGVSEKMLSQTLKNLVGDGLVWRHVEPTVPPQVTYGLTELGEGTARHLGGMFDWIRGNAETIMDARAKAEA